ncbi:hypothetical protein ACN27F_31460 [Solwaraspora sp. WMMB335]
MTVIVGDADVADNRLTAPVTAPTPGDIATYLLTNLVNSQNL